MFEKKEKKRSKKNNSFEYAETPELKDDFTGGYPLSEDRSSRKKKKTSDREREISVMSKKTPEEVAFYKQIKTVEEELERDLASKPKEKKKNPVANLNEEMKNIFSLSHLGNEIQGYGYDFKASDYLKNVGLVLLAMVAASIFFGLKFWGVAMLAVAIVAVFPFIWRAQVIVVANNEDFEQIILYVEQMIIAFKNNPKILLAMRETLEIVEGKMHDRVAEAIHIIETDSKSENVYQRAFAVIEGEYKCSRIRTLHRFLHTVELENSENYGESLDNLYSDIKSWQKRTYKFQAALLSTKNQLTILLGASIGFAGLFAYLMRTVENSVVDDGGETLIHIVKNPAYQVSTVIFFLIFILIYTIVNTKLNGSWLVNDLENPQDRQIMQTMREIALLDEDVSKKNRRIAAAVLAMPILVYALFKKNIILITIALLFAVLVLKMGESTNKKKKKRVQEELKKEFPLWMRDVAVSLKNRVVVRAVIESEENAAYVMKPFIRNFLARVEREPASIRPYMEFFGPYSAHELSTAIKTLYSIRTLSSTDSQRQVNDLIERNQDLLAESERIRQENSVAGIGFIGLLPMVLMAFLLMVYLVVMLLQFMALLNATMAG